MKSTLLSLFFILFLNKTYACCGGYNVYVFPAGKNIGSNSIFVIGFSEDDFKYKGKLNKFAFFACNKQGVEYPLEVVQTLFTGTNGQVVLRSKKDFNLNDSLSIKVVLQ